MSSSCHCIVLVLSLSLSLCLSLSLSFRAFFDTTGGLWMKGGLVGKVGSIFTSTGTGGGRETTALTAYTQLVHHGMLIAPIGYSTPDVMNADEVHGVSPYGAGTVAGADGSKKPTELELRVAKHQGALVTGYAAKLKK
jgi:NAD(P)H dehydrogenase (quinone)